MKIYITLASVVLLAAFANGAEELDSLKKSFNDTVRGRCQSGTTQATTTGAGSTGTGTNGGTATTSPNTNGGTKPSADSTPATPTTTTTTTTPTTTPTTTTTTKTTTKTIPGAQAPARKKRDASFFCGIEETKVSEAKDVPDFHTKITDYSNCQKVNCTSLNDAVEKLIKDSGASSLKIFGSLLVVMLVVTFFG